MISPAFFYDSLTEMGVGFYTGVPDSLLKHFCAYLKDNVPPERNIIAANEGCSVGLAAGYHLATGNVPLVYMQNSGMGNATNPLLSLADPDVYNIPIVLVIGWRGEPGVHDEPQHVKQGRITCNLLDTMGIPYCVLPDDEAGCGSALKTCREHLEKNGSPYAIVVRKDTFSEYKPVNKTAEKEYPMTREEALEIISGKLSGAVFVSTTGMASRELYEIRDRRGESHGSDFLTVGSMGHSSQIALGIALNRPDRKVVCVDGDGAVIMHMGGMSTIATQAPGNLIHIMINNGVHDSVGGQPTTSREIDIHRIAESMGYRHVMTVETPEDLRKALECGEGPVFLQVMVRRGARKDLGRPKSTPRENKEALMKNIGSI
jgi:phosphonopyruvate decarboxylase